MADENKDLETLTDPAVTEAGDNGNAQAEPAQEEATQLPFALGEESQAGEQATEASDAPAESDPTPAAPVDLGISDSPTPDAEGLSETPAVDSLPAGDAAPTDAPTDEAPAATGTPAAADAPNDLGASDAADPVADAPAEAPTTSTSTSIGGDKASDVEPPAAPQQEPAAAPAPAPAPAPSSPGLFDHGTAIRLPDMTVDVSDGYPVPQPNAAPAHPQHFGELVNDGVGDDAGKVAEAPKYPTDQAPEVVDGSDKGQGAQSADAAPAGGSDKPADAGVDSAIPPHVEGKLAKLMDKISAIESKLSQLVHELLD